MVQTAVFGFMLGGSWLVYDFCRWALGRVTLSFVTTDSDRVALSFLGAITFLLLIAAMVWGQRRR